MRAILLFTLWRDLNRSKWEGGGRKWFKSGDEKTHVKFVGEIKNGLIGRLRADGYNKLSDAVGAHLR